LFCLRRINPAPITPLPGMTRVRAIPSKDLLLYCRSRALLGVAPAEPDDVTQSVTEKRRAQHKQLSAERMRVHRVLDDLKVKGKLAFTADYVWLRDGDTDRPNAASRSVT
jgi:hypothetical protein